MFTMSRVFESDAKQYQLKIWGNNPVKAIPWI